MTEFRDLAMPGALFLALSLMLGLISAAHGQTMSGVGARDCQAFSFALEKDSSQALDSYVAWAQGFISAFNWANARQSDIRIDAAAIINWLGPYCEANPNLGVYTALQQLIGRNAR